MDFLDFSDRKYHVKNEIVINFYYCLVCDVKLDELNVFGAFF